jgi:hypothetical protein
MGFLRRRSRGAARGRGPRRAVWGSERKGSFLKKRTETRFDLAPFMADAARFPQSKNKSLFASFSSEKEDFFLALPAPC